MCQGNCCHNFGEIFTKLLDTGEDVTVSISAQYAEDGSMYFIARVKVNGCVHSVISYESEADALEQAADQALGKLDGVQESGSNVLKTILDELGLEKAISLLVKLSKVEQ